MATTMAMKVVDFASESIMKKLERMLVEEAALLAGVEDDVRYIVAELRSINSFLTDMSTRRKLDDQMQNWVQEVREVAYDAEDSIEVFERRLRSTPYDERGIKGFFKHFLRRIKSLKARHNIASWLKKLKDQVEEIRKRHKRYSPPNETSTSSGTATSSDMADGYSDPRIFSHFAEEAQLVGINPNRDMLIGWVMDENCLELRTISLVGFGGLGKTTLAKTVYDDPVIVGGHFQCRAWITVSQNYGIRELLKKIIRKMSVTEQKIRDGYGCQDASLNTEQILNMMDESQLVETVRGHLNGKRYLLVFDDVWSAEAWVNLSILLPSEGEEGSRVIVTTRSEEVANTSCSRNRKFIFKISPLSPEQSWELFCRKIFEAPDHSCPPDLENVGREILQKCDGMPLAVVTIGGLLASRPDKKLEEWKELRDDLRLELQTNDRLSKINQILLLSYNDLPYCLKPCFLFLGIFPEDYEIRRKRLTRRWIAEGIVSGIDGFPAEKMAERCFNQLVSRSLVQPSEFNDNGTVKSCRVHDMMLEVIISISRKENFVALLNEHSTLTIPPQHQKIRRLSWHGGDSGLGPDTDLCHLRSFTAFGKDVPLKDYRKQRLLRAIDLELKVSLNDYFCLHPKSFSELFLLKYLSLRESYIWELPDSVGDLQNLEFLDIRGTFITVLPNTIVKLQKLIYLLAGNIITSYPLKTNPIKGLRKVPNGIGKLKSLAAFGKVWCDDVPLLQEIGELGALQKLAIGFEVEYLSYRTTFPEELSAMLSKLKDKLRSLNVYQNFNDNWKNTPYDVPLKMALDNVASPPLQLYKLQIDVRLGGLPAWFVSLKQVVKITLSNTLLQFQDLQVLRNLNTLVKLVLGKDSFVNFKTDLVFDQGGFTHLKILVIDPPYVRFKKGAVQRLEILKLSDRLGFRVIGVEHLPGLKEIHVRTANEYIIEMVKNIAANHSNRPKCLIDTSLPPMI